MRRIKLVCATPAPLHSTCAYENKIQTVKSIVVGATVTVGKRLKAGRISADGGIRAALEVLDSLDIFCRTLLLAFQDFRNRALPSLRHNSSAICECCDDAWMTSPSRQPSRQHSPLVALDNLTHLPLTTFIFRSSHQPRHPRSVVPQALFDRTASLLDHKYKTG